MKQLKEWKVLINNFKYMVNNYFKKLQDILNNISKEKENLNKLESEINKKLDNQEIIISLTKLEINDLILNLQRIDSYKCIPFWNSPRTPIIDKLTTYLKL